MPQRCRGSVLVLADEAPRRLALAALLRVGGFSVATAGTAPQLLLRLHWPGLADLMLVGGQVRSPEARQLFRWMSQQPQLQALPIILLTPQPPPPELASCFVARACTPESELSLLRLVGQVAHARRQAGRPLWQPLQAETHWSEVLLEEARSAEGDEPYGPPPP